VDRVERGFVSIPEDNLADLSDANGISGVNGAFWTSVGLPLRELCHDLIEPAATIRWLVGAAGAESSQDLPNRLGAIAVAAGQIAAICEQILGPPQHYAGVRLDLLADDAAANAQLRYAGVIDVVSEPVTALAQPGDVIRLLYNLLSNACRAAGPAGRVRAVIDEADGQARLAIADSGNGFGHPAPGGRVGLGLEIIGALALKYGGSVQLRTGDLGGLAVTVLLPAAGGSSN
jgi:signal transduction histidine kinase